MKERTLCLPVEDLSEPLLFTAKENGVEITTDWTIYLLSVEGVLQLHTFLRGYLIEHMKR